MLIRRIKAKNYKTYLDLDLDLTVQAERPIILIGGHNGGGKTTLFEAISGALYGLKIKDRRHFEELLNNGASGRVKPQIELELTFTGLVLNQEKKYILRRLYMLNPEGKPVESVHLNMDGNSFVYGTAMPLRERQEAEQTVNKIIKANLPQELSQYFLFDAMQSSDLIKANVFAQVIKDNIENVLGFNKYLQLRRASERLQQKRAQERLEADKERKDYAALCDKKKLLESELEALAKESDSVGRYLVSVQEDYDRAKQGSRDMAATRQKIEELKGRVADVERQAEHYADDMRRFVEGIEQNVFWSKVATDLNAEVNQIIRAKNALRQQQETGFPPESLREIAHTVVDFLREMGWLSGEVREEQVADFLLARQGRAQVSDPYAFLDEEDVAALMALTGGRATNGFASLNRTRQDIEAKMGQLPHMQSQIESLQRQLTVGNEALIKEYEEKQKRLQQIGREEEEKRGEIQAIEKRLHKFDITLQVEPDPKYDTLVKLKPFFDEVANELLRRKREQIETEMQQQLNELLLAYKGHIARVEISDTMEHFNIRLFHKAGNEISLGQLNAASKQIFIQVLLKVLRNLGDYNPPVMIDTVMGVLDEESRDALMELYFPQLAEQTILLCTTSEIRKDSDYKKLEPFISRTYTLHRNVEEQNTYVEEGYFGLSLDL